MEGRSAKKMMQAVPEDPPRGVKRSLDEARLRQQAIGVKLRQMFDAVVSEPVPEEFLEILRKAEKTGSEKTGAEKTGEGPDGKSN
jgi:hypothetical protein